VSHDNPQSAEALVWDAIVLSTLAEKKGGIGALSLVKEAKLKLEQAEAIDPTVLGGSVYASLGSLYSKVPGWPIGFGSDKKAEKYFQKALALNPQGLDINYFFAEFLAENGKDQLALKYVEKALHAPQMVERPLADKGRREQAQKLKEFLLGS
jgi:tetratricopeptide (TPR) repeat protein